MLKLLKFLQDEAQFPEGFPAVLGKRLSTADPAAFFQKTTDTGYYFILEEWRASWVDDSVPSEILLEVFRDYASRVYMGAGAVNLVNIATPGPSAGIHSAKAAMPFYAVYPPGSVISAKVSGYSVGSPAAINLVALGRYVLDPSKLG